MSQFHAFKGILHRDLLVFWRNLRGNSVRIFVQPAFFLVVFGVLMPKLGLFAKGYAGVLIPGVVTISAMTAASFGVGALVGLSFFRNKEIRAHLLAPISLELFVLEKILYGVFQALVSSVSMLLVGWLMFRNISVPNPLWFLVIVSLTGIAFSSIGIAIGSRMRLPPVMFEVLQLIIMPMFFFGATFFPLSAIRELSPALFWALHLLPNVYTSEGLRALMTPEVPPLPLFYAIAGLVVWSALLFPLALKEFRRRAVS